MKILEKKIILCIIDIDDKVNEIDEEIRTLNKEIRLFGEPTVVIYLTDNENKQNSIRATLQGKLLPLAVEEEVKKVIFYKIGHLEYNELIISGL
jgi:hypothetical protein